MMYYVEHGSTYFQISGYAYIGSKYKKARIRWYSRPGMTYLFSTVEKIPLALPDHWIKLER